MNIFLFTQDDVVLVSTIQRVTIKPCSFSTIWITPRPLLYFCASSICLMVQAQPHLANVMRLVSDKANVAEEEITTLLKLYQRRPGGGEDNNPIVVPASYS